MIALAHQESSSERCAARLAIRGSADVLAARSKVRQVGQLLGFAPTEVALLAAVVCELARNILHYAGRGEIVICGMDGPGAPCVMLVASDQGPGIADVDRALKSGLSWAGRVKLGLPSARRVMDELEVDSGPGRGTVVRAMKWATWTPASRP